MKSGLLLGADFFNVSKYRRITFKSTSVKKSNSGYEVFGDLTIAGVTRSVVLEAENPAPPQKGMRERPLPGYLQQPQSNAVILTLARSTPTA
jgi:polyisoprenoid-binding protein YceI